MPLIVEIKGLSDLFNATIFEEKVQSCFVNTKSSALKREQILVFLPKEIKREDFNFGKKIVACITVHCNFANKAQAKTLARAFLGRLGAILVEHFVHWEILRVFVRAKNGKEGQDVAYSQSKKQELFGKDVFRAASRLENLLRTQMNMFDWKVEANSDDVSIHVNGIPKFPQEDIHKWMRKVAKLVRKVWSKQNPGIGGWIFLTNKDESGNVQEMLKIGQSFSANFTNLDI